MCWYAIVQEERTDQTPHMTAARQTSTLIPAYLCSSKSLWYRPYSMMPSPPSDGASNEYIRTKTIGGGLNRPFPLQCPHRCSECIDCDGHFFFSVHCRDGSGWAGVHVYSVYQQAHANLAGDALASGFVDHLLDEGGRIEFGGDDVRTFRVGVDVHPGVGSVDGPFHV